ncbi:MAG: hypothetical protein RSC68_00120 [Acinetobacter sp.]
MADSAWTQMVNEDGYNLQYVDEADRTEALCRLAMLSNGDAYPFVPVALRTPVIRNISVQSSAGRSIQYMNADEQTNELLMMAMNVNGMLLQYVCVQTADICEAAIRQNPDCWKYVRDQTPALYSLLLTRKKDAKL